MRCSRLRWQPDLQSSLQWMAVRQLLQDTVQWPVVRQVLWSQSLRQSPSLKSDPKCHWALAMLAPPLSPMEHPQPFSGSWALSLASQGHWQHTWMMWSFIQPSGYTFCSNWGRNWKGSGRQVWQPAPVNATRGWQRYSTLDSALGKVC